MEKKYLLSICIPTYNRAGYLKNCLDSIVVQLDDKRLNNLVEIVVSDNASEDNTRELVKKYQNNFDDIKYFRNEKNLGFDGNVINSVLKASGKYCWHLGDDDSIQNGALAFIADFLSQKDVALLTVNFHPFMNIDMSLKKDDHFSEELIKYCDSPEDFYRKGYCQGILSIFIFNRDLWIKTDRKNYEEGWSYYEIILRMLPSSNLKLAYLSHPALFIGQDYRWNENGAALFTALHVIRVFKNLKKLNYDNDFIDGEINRFSKNLPSSVLVAKAANLKCSFANLKTVCKELKDYPTYLFYIILIFFVPNFMVKAVKKIKKKINNNKK